MFTNAITERLERRGLELIELQYRSPNLNAYIERFVQSIQQECLDRFIVFGLGAHGSSQPGVPELLSGASTSGEGENPADRPAGDVTRSHAMSANVKIEIPNLEVAGHATARLASGSGC